MNDSNAIIRVTDVWKKFTIQRGRAGDLRERFAALRAAKNEGVSDTELWALKEIAFTVGAGQSLGIVGHNGSGKSTLLKLLTGILKPTQGDVKMKGRVGALIEVGAGFHPDLSGRENIYLNGSILGLSRREIGNKFDDIVGFAGLEQFIDTPVKRYSSGMYMRLGFSVAAHTDPDILLIDEVLAVGDTFFQRKCLRHLEAFVRNGGAVVFVSHAMGQVGELCKTCLWLDHGELKYHGPTQDAIDRYMTLVDEREDEEFRRHHPAEWATREEERRRQEWERFEAERLAQAETEARRHLRRADPNNPQSCHLKGVVLRDGRGEIGTRFRPGEEMSVEIAYRFGRPLPAPVFGMDIYKSDGTHIFTTSNYDHHMTLSDLPLEGAVWVRIPFLCLNAGMYRIQVNLFADSVRPQWWERPEDEQEEAACFEVVTDHPINGSLYLPNHWETHGGRDCEAAGARAGK